MTVQSFAKESHIPLPLYRTNRSVTIPPLSLGFLPVQKFGNERITPSECLIVNRTFSAEPGNEWVIPNSIITKLEGCYYVSMLNPSRKSITVQAGKEIAGLQSMESTTWPVMTEETVYGLSEKTHPTPEFFFQTLKTILIEHRPQMGTMESAYQI